jgi:hypothetical protein
MPYGSIELAIAVPDLDASAIRDRFLELKACSTKRYILEIRDSPPLLPRFFPIGQLNQFRAEEAGIYTPFLHVCLIGRNCLQL